MPRKSFSNESSTPSFRVTNTIFTDKDQDPSTRHLILFHDNLVYDLSENINESNQAKTPSKHEGGDQIVGNAITVYDLTRGRVILLDRETQTRSTLSTEDLIKFTAQARATAKTPELADKLGMDAEAVFDTAAGVYSITFGGIRYEVSTEKVENPMVANLYGQFADMASRLNLVRRLGLPPFAQMKLSQRIASDGEIPKETRLSIRRGLQIHRFHSTHQLIAQVSQSDLKRMDEIGSMLALYREVSLNDFGNASVAAK